MRTLCVLLHQIPIHSFRSVPWTKWKRKQFAYRSDNMQHPIWSDSSIGSCKFWFDRMYESRRFEEHSSFLGIEWMIRRTVFIHRNEWKFQCRTAFTSDVLICASLRCDHCPSLRNILFCVSAIFVSVFFVLFRSNFQRFQLQLSEGIRFARILFRFCAVTIFTFVDANKDNDCSDIYTAQTTVNHNPKQNKCIFDDVLMNESFPSCVCVHNQRMNNAFSSTSDGMDTKPK